MIATVLLILFMVAAIGISIAAHIQLRDARRLETPRPVTTLTVMSNAGLAPGVDILLGYGDDAEKFEVVRMVSPTVAEVRKCPRSA